MGINAASAIFSIVTAIVKNEQINHVLKTVTATNGDEIWGKIERFVNSMKKDVMIFVYRNKSLGNNYVFFFHSNTYLKL